MTVTLEYPDMARLLAAARWWEMPALRALAGGARPLGYACGPDPAHPEYTFLAAAGPGGVRRSLVLLKFAGRSLLVTFDLVPGEATWVLRGLEAAPRVRGKRFTLGNLTGTPLLPAEATLTPGAGEIAVRGGSGLFLNVLEFSPPEPVELVESLDFAGIRTAGRVVLFHVEPTMARSAVSYFVDGTGMHQHLVSGLAPGTWEIWWNGWLEDFQAGVEPRAGTLYFKGREGSYFLRRV